MLRPSSSAEPRAKSETPLFKCNDDRDDDVCGARVKPFLQRDSRDFLFFVFLFVRGRGEKGREFFLVCEFGFRSFLQERRIFTNSFAGEREKKREKERGFAKVALLTADHAKMYLKLRHHRSAYYNYGLLLLLL